MIVRNSLEIMCVFECMWGCNFFRTIDLQVIKIHLVQFCGCEAYICRDEVPLNKTKVKHPRETFKVDNKQFYFFLFFQIFIVFQIYHDAELEANAGMDTAFRPGHDGGGHDDREGDTTPPLSGDEEEVVTDDEHKPGPVVILKYFFSVYSLFEAFQHMASNIVLVRFRHQLASQH